MGARNVGIVVSVTIAVMLVVGCNKKEEPLPVGPKVIAPAGESSGKPGKSATTYNWAEEKKSATSGTKWSDEKWKQYCKNHNYTDATCGNALHRHAVEIGVSGISDKERLRKLNEGLK